jgi:tetratricopeptide (TPR) repeat protein
MRAYSILKCVQLLLGACFIIVASARSEEAPDCAVVFQVERAAIDRALDLGMLDDALERAKALLAHCPGVPAASHILAKAHVASGDQAAAALTLRDCLRRDPDDCATRAWLAWVLIKQGDLDQARSTLDDSTACPTTEPERRRLLLLDAMLARERRDHAAARKLLERVGDRAALLPEDRALSRDLGLSLRAGWSPPFQLAAELSAGGTSNAIAGSPTDTPGDSVSSVLSRLRLFARLRAPESARFAPFMETSIKAHGIGANSARDLSYANLGVRAGLELYPAGVTSRLAYRHEELWLNLDGGTRFSAADRMELDASLSRLDLKIGFGRRDFDDDDRSRDEIDASVIHSTRIGNNPAFFAFGARSYRARRSAYDQLGATLSGALANISVGRRCTAELMAVAAFDYYPSSGGPDGRLVFGTDRKRRDGFGRLSLSLWKRISKDARIGVSYDFTRRWSTADRPSRYYPYTDHRGMIELRFFSSGNPWRRPMNVGPDHVAIPYETLTSQEGAAWFHEILRPVEDLTQGCGDVCDVP